MPSNARGTQSCPPGWGRAAARSLGTPPVSGARAGPRRRCAFHAIRSMSSPFCITGFMRVENAKTWNRTVQSIMPASSMASSNSRMTWRMRMLISKLNRSTGVLRFDGTNRCGTRVEPRSRRSRTARHQTAAMQIAHSHPLSVMSWSGRPCSATHGSNASAYTRARVFRVSAVSPNAILESPSISAATYKPYSWSLHARSRWTEYMKWSAR
mmetsp:Transcript_38972/g.102171  ORF Transcript_38972/g.102171 Transcript_38972/m.102171 type:complete len:211 (-) Transcript_38972:447-1079(-)